ncbi:MAG: YdbL family protein [Pseudomonadota bacterium]
MKLVRNSMLFAAAVLAASAPVHAERNPAYAAARAAGQVGEQVNGYLGVVGANTPELQRIVDDINIKRKSVYARKARENNATIEQYAMTAGCQAIARTVPGEKYQAPDRSWKTRTAAPPQRDPRCP